MNKNLSLLWLIFLSTAFETIFAADSCVNMWDENPNPNVKKCDVLTESGDKCQFPFTYKSVSYSTCIVTNNPNLSPQCLTTSNLWSNCKVPTDAAILQVTTRKAGGWWINGASMNGGTMVWISGFRFAASLFSTSPTSATSNQVYLVGSFASYDCEIHPDKTTTTQITCYTSALPIGKYLVKIMVNGNFIPSYQYNSLDQAYVNIADSNTPKITSLTPVKGLPGSFLTLNGDFKTICYARDDSTNDLGTNCGDDSQPRISRIFVGGSNCELYDPATNLLYGNLTTNSLICKANKPEVSYFNVSMLVSNEYGRSLLSSSTYYVSPIDSLYNFQTYAAVNSVSPQIGSTAGGDIKITGQYFYTDVQVPAKIEVGGQPCSITSFDMTSLPNTTFVCTNVAQPTSATEYYGNRGINLIRDNVYTALASLAAATPTANAQTSVLNQASYTDTQQSDVTVWLKGFFNPKISSNYEFSLVTNGEAQLFVSTDATSANKAPVASTTSTSTLKGTVQLASNNNYYFLVIASKQGGSLNIAVNGKMFQTSLTDKVSANVFNEKQEIEITSTVVSQSYKITYGALTPTSGQSETQDIVIKAFNQDTPFVLSFASVSTTTLLSGATAQNVQDALNDLPSLTPNLVTVTQSLANDSVSLIYRVKFSADLGDVPLLSELTGNVNATMTEVTQGVPTGNYQQLKIEGGVTNMFKLNDTSSNIKTVITQAFGIRCPASILNSADTISTSESESCAWTSNKFNDSVFCGKCSKKNSNNLFWNLNSTLLYKYVCFAYKLSKPFVQVNYQVIDPVTGSLNTLTVNVETIADNQWHYNCTDLTIALKGTSFAQYGVSYLKVFQAWVWPSVSDMYIDTVTVRKTLPLGYNDGLLATTRRLYPTLQILSNQLSVSTATGSVTLTYRPANCSNNLAMIALTQNFSSITIAELTAASPPVTGSFQLQWNNTSLDIPANMTQEDLTSLFQSIQGFGFVDITRSNDCAGYKWTTKWLTGGDKPPLTLGSNLTLTGNTPAIRAATLQDGAAVFSPIQDDLLRTYHTSPQVTVAINNVNSKCSSSCDFQWASSATPVVSNIDITTKTSIVITGTGFDTTLKNNIVLIGDVPCTIVTATSTQLTCSAGQNPIGSYQFKVSVVNKGLALMNNNPTITFALTAQSFTPLTSSTGGGIVLNISGEGFTSSCTVTVDGNPCPVISASYSLITCTIPANPTLTDKQVDVIVSQNAVTSKVTTQLTYDATNSAFVTSITPSTLSVLGGETITIVGTNLPATPSVSFGLNKLTVVSSTSTQIVVKSAVLAPGLYDVKIPVGSIGNANINTQVEYVLYVSSITPNAGSIRGGAVVQVNGNGFSTNCSLNQVTFGKQSCNALSCEKSWIKCQTSNAYLVQKIDNSAADPYYGKGYAWSQSYLKISKGDTVNWLWQPPTGISGVKFQVVQVADASSFTASGFTSGDPAATGSFSFQFNQAGTYHYWSGYVEDSAQITFRGVVVVQDSFDKELEVSVSLNGFNAQKCTFPFVYNSNSYSSCTQTDAAFNWCSPTAIYSGQKLKCDPIATPTADVCPGNALNLASLSLTAPTSIYKMLFTTGQNQLPTITAVPTDAMAFNSNITIQGTGFSTTQCENKVLIGGVDCPITVSSDTQIVCKLADNSGLIPNYPYKMELLVKNIGYALQNNSFTLRFLPVITALSPTTGSVAGSTQIVITGNGFLDNKQYTVITIGNNQFYNNDGRNTVVTYNSITINSFPGLDGDIQVSVVSNSATAICGLASCNFTYSQSITPTLTAVSPTSINTAGTITLTGTNFGTDTTKIVVSIGKQSCTPLTASDTAITCSLVGLNLGSQTVKVNINGVGDATNAQNLAVTGTETIVSISPSTGSVNGGTFLTISGNGFDDSTQVLLHTVACVITSRAINSITCVTGAHAAATVNYIITTNGVTYTTSSFSFIYDSAISPTISSLSPTHATSGLLAIAGTGFGTDSTKITVKVGAQTCAVQSAIDTQVTCQLSATSAGLYPVLVVVSNQGNSNADLKFTYDLTVVSLAQTSGSIGGSLSLVINGQGFSANSTLTICSNTCDVTQSSVTSITCKVPIATVKNADTICSVNVAENGLTANLANSFTYSVSLTPTVSSVSPLRGGTGGGTLLTITGSSFPSDSTKIAVTIAGSVCDITTSSSTQIQCRTNTYAASSIKAVVNVFIQDAGLAYNDGTVQFEYIDLWSSKWTWGGLNPPGEGELAVITANQQIYFDAATTPVLKGIIIQGGSLIFDDNQDVSLNAEYIIITDGGKLQVGTKQVPFQHNAVITMYGSVRSVELPIYGSKVLGLRNGIIDIHGKNVGVTWTHLGATSLAGSNTITLKEAVNWPIGSQIVVATTGDKFSPGQSEARKIIARSADNTTLTLDSPLLFDHLGTKRTIGTGAKAVDIWVRAEVGLLSRNVVFKGSVDNSWAPLLTAPACPDGFNPAEFAVQTCFLGRYGPELGTDQFGAIILASGRMRRPNEPESVILRLSNVEFFHVGQAFRLGRYPIHFHMNGDMPSSFVSECAIRESFNRATNIHASNYLTIERNVIYDIMGGAYFLEDGIEIGNVFKYNLAVFVRSSSSLLNEDVTPAAFWATNPNNTYLHNAVAGSTHFGWWYRLLERPDGPSFDPNYCPRNIPFGVHTNNSVHSTGRFGLWVFPGYTPTVGGSCSDGRPSVAKFYGLTSWSNDKGAEFVEANGIQFRNFTVWDNYAEGIAAKTIQSHEDANTNYGSVFYNEQTGSVIADSVIIGNSLGGTKSITQDGIVVPWDRGELLSNVAFYNFPEASSNGMRCPFITGRCVLGCGGWTVQSKGLYFENVKYRTLHRWDWDVVFQDLDGTLTGIAGDVVVAKDNITVKNPSCRDTGQFSNGVSCSNTKTWIRFAYNNYQPFLAVLINITNSASNMAACPQYKKRLTHPIGFMMSLEANQTYSLSYDQAERPTNISYSGTFYGFKPYDYLIMKYPLAKKPDRVRFDGLNDLTQTYYPVSALNNHGDWFWDNDTFTLSFMLKNDKNKLPFIDYPLTFSAVKCRYAGCQPPTNPGFKLPVTSRPADALFWSNLTTWSMSQPGWGGSQFGLPQNNDSVLIPDGKYVVVDCALPKLQNLQIEGVLEFDNGINHHLEVDMIFINGGQLIIGWENNPITTNVEIVLTGQKDSMNFKLPDGLSLIGGKGIGVYGGLDIHGKPVNVTWTRLNQTVTAGSNTITLVEPVDWKTGDEILLTTSTYYAGQSEVLKILTVSANLRTLTLNASVKYEHIGYSERLPNGQQYQIAAAVGLLTRNVKIIGGDYATQEADLYGFRIIVSDYSTLLNGLYAFYKGYARVSNAQFVRPGQFSLGTADDSKYGILFSNLGAYNTTRPSYVRSCAFHDGYNAAIGIFASNSIPIENNVIYRTITFGLNIEGNSNIIRRNLVARNTWFGSIITWDAALDKKYWGAINLIEADSYVLEDNYVAGAERVGIYYRGDLCAGQVPINGYNHSVKGNTIVGALSGIAIFPVYPTVSSQQYLMSLECVRISGFSIFKSTHWGIYYQGTGRLVVESNLLADNQVNLFTFVLRPTSLQHEFGTKTVTIANNIIVGQSPSYNCANDKRPTDDFNFQQASSIQAFGAGSSYDSKIGVVWANFLDGPNMAPFKPWAGIKTYNQINGLMLIKNVTFAYFGKNCLGSYDAAISGSLKNDDGQHPVKVQSIKLFNVNNASKVWLFRPNIGLINPSDCIDMDCDGQKKNLLTDLDGSFLGTPGHIISQSEFEWGSQQRGLGDFRIPKEALAAPNGSMLAASSVYTYPGIVRDEQLCQYNADWQAYECHGLEYKMLVIESMDNDTETRRLSPVAIISDNKYLDLINGPQDHGWCSGYTCQKRVSTFIALVAANKSYDIYLTSTPPNQLRFRILDADASFKIRLSMYYVTAQRIDLYKNDTFISPTNADYSSGKFQIKDPGTNVAAYTPTYLNMSGVNFFSKDDRKMYFSIDGSTYIDLKIAPVLFVRFGVPAITPDDFFNTTTLIGNFALLLGIDPSKIRRVEIIRASSKKRDATSQSYVVLTIFDDAPTSLNDTATANTQKDTLNQLDAKISNMYMTGQLQKQAQSLNITLASLSVQRPNSNTTAQPIVRIASIVVVKQAADCTAQAPCLTQPSIMVVDENGKLVTNVGNPDHPWIIQAKINSTTNPNVNLIFESEVAVVNGFANFTKIGVSNLVDKLVLSYSFKLPNGLNESTFDPMHMITNPIKASKPQLTCLNYGSSDILADENTAFNISVVIVDKNSKLQIPDITWNNYTWTAQVSMYTLGNYPAKGSLVTSNATVTFDTSTGYAVFSNLAITKAGMYLLSISVATSGNEYSSQCYSNSIQIKEKTVSMISYDSSSQPDYIIKFNGSYSSIIPAEIKANVYNYMTSYGLKIGGMSCYAGSVYVVFYSTDSNISLINTLIAKGINVSSNLVFVSADIGSTTITCTNCTVVVINSGTSATNAVAAATTTANALAIANAQIIAAVSAGAIAGGIIGGVVLIAALVLGFFGYKEWKKIKVKTRSIRPVSVAWEMGERKKTPSFIDKLTHTTENPPPYRETSLVNKKLVENI